MFKRVVCIILIVCTVTMSITPKKAYSGEVVIGVVAWDVIGTLIAVLAGYEVYDMVTDKESEYANPNIWVPDGNLTQEKIEFVRENASTDVYQMTDEKAQEFWKNINNEEFQELKNLYNSNRNPDFYTNDGLGLAINLNIFKGIFKYYRDKIIAISNGDDNSIPRVIFEGHYEYLDTDTPIRRISTRPDLYGDTKHALSIFATKDRYSRDVIQVTGYVFSNTYKRAEPLAWMHYVGGHTQYLSFVTSISSINAPAFNSDAEAISYLETGLETDMINKYQYPSSHTVPSGFLPSVKTSLPDDTEKLDGLMDWMTDLITPTMPSQEVVKTIGGEEVDSGGIFDLNPEDEQKDYFFIIGDIIQWLQKIYNFIISIPGLIIEWLKKIYDFLVGIPEAIINGIKNLLEWLFVPNTVALLPMVDLLRDKINNSISVATYPLKIILNLFDKLTNLSASDCILIFPEINFMGKKLNDEYVFNFTQFLRRDEYKRIYKIYRSFTSFIIILAVLTTALRKFNENLKG